MMEGFDLIMVLPPKTAASAAHPRRIYIGSNPSSLFRQKEDTPMGCPLFGGDGGI
ncbi:MAG: hypothetical protein IJW14_04565 [Oscillospiraceae bacterium]|nr:hypothetical protein [Oscillospiraceae bacterium]